MRKFPSKVHYHIARNSLTNTSVNVDSSPQHRKIRAHMLTQHRERSFEVGSDVALTGFVVDVVAPPQSTLRLGFAVLVSVHFRAARPCVLGVLAVIVEL